MVYLWMLACSRRLSAIPARLLLLQGGEDAFQFILVTVNLLESLTGAQNGRVRMS